MTPPELDVSGRERPRRAVAERRRRRVRHRLLGLRVDRHRADARGGRRHQLDRPGRDRSRPCPLRAPRDADRRRCGSRSPSGARPMPTATLHCSTTRVATGRSAWRDATSTRQRTPCGWRRWRAARGSRSRSWPERCGARRRTTACTPMPGFGALPTVQPTCSRSARRLAHPALARCAGGLRATCRGGGARPPRLSCRTPMRALHATWQSAVRAGPEIDRRRPAGRGAEARRAGAANR